MTDFKNITSEVKIQYPTMEPASLQRSVSQIKGLLESEDYYGAQLVAYARYIGNSALGQFIIPDGNIDGGRADSIYGGIFADVDGGGA